MHLSLDDDNELLRGSVRAFAKDRLRQKCREWDEAGALAPDVLEEGWQLGLLSAGIPARFGGAGEKDETVPSALTGVVALEELAWGDLAYAARLTAPNHVAVPVALFGSADDKAALLPKLAGAQALPAATGAWIEPHRGWDLGAVKAHAKAVPGDGFTVHGAKALVPAGDVAEWIAVYARSGAGATGFDGVDALLVEGKTPNGLSRTGREDAIGPRALVQTRLALDGCPARCIGSVRGVDYRRLAQRALVASAAAAVGVARAATEYSAGYAKERVAFGRPIAQYQSIAFMIADAATDVEGARWMTWKAAWRIDRGEDAMREAALAFRFATDAAWRIADHGVQILGGHGVIRDHLAELFFRNARTLAATPGALIV